MNTLVNVSKVSSDLRSEKSIDSGKRFQIIFFFKTKNVKSKRARLSIWDGFNWDTFLSDLRSEKVLIQENVFKYFFFSKKKT